jgi:hypothetical protein
MRGRLAMLITVMLASVNLVWGLQIALTSQAVPASPDWTATIEHLTLNGALIVAVVALWKQLGKKDDLLIASVKTVTESLAAAAASNIELRVIITENVSANRSLADVISKLDVSIGELPCTAGVHRGKGQE